MFCKDQTIKITTSRELWMIIKSVVSVAAIIGYIDYWLQHRIKETLHASLGYRVHKASRYCQSCSGKAAGRVSRANRCASMCYTLSIGDRTGS